MRVLSGPWTDWENEPTAVAVGVFDGVHLGHRRVLDHVLDGDLTAAVLTFEPHPVAVVAPEHAPLLLTPLDMKVALFGQAGISTVAVATFDEEMREMTPEAFSSQVLVDGLAAKRVVVGADFHFGKNRAGSPEVLSRIGAELGFQVTVVPLLGDGDGISSSAIRAALAQGHVAQAAAWLGRPFGVAGLVVPGDRRGTAIGFPTANLELAPGLAVPARGVYAVVASVGHDQLAAVANVGVRPTFQGGEDEVVEVHILDFDADLYGTIVGADFIERIRDEKAFGGVDELVAQIGADVETARRIHTS